MFVGHKQMLIYYIEDMMFKGWFEEAKGVADRNNLMNDLNDDIRD